MSHFGLRQRTCVLAVSVAAIAATPLAAAPAAHAARGRTVTQSLSSFVRLAVHDPGNTLGRPGDTHELHVDLRDTEGQGTIRVSSFECGPHDTARTPQELGCSHVGDDDVAVAAASATLRNGSLRWRAATGAGALRLRLTGAESRHWLHRDWQNAEGTRRESGREVITTYTAAAATGTFAGLTLTQPAAWRAEGRSIRSRTVTHVGRGPAVAIPVLPPAGTGTESDQSTARSSATWVRPLPDGTALYGHVWGIAASPENGFGPMASAVVSRQRCDPGEKPLGRGDRPAPGRCDVLAWLADDAMEAGYAFAFDNRLGTARLSGRSSVEPGQPPQNHDVTASWRGGDRVGVRTVQRVWDAPELGGLLITTTESGIRWTRPAAQVTWEGQPVQVTEATQYAYHRRTRVTPGTSGSRGTSAVPERARVRLTTAARQVPAPAPTTVEPPVLGKARYTCHTEGAIVAVRLRNPNRQELSFQVGISGGAVMETHAVTLAGGTGERAEFHGIPDGDYELVVFDVQGDVVADGRVAVACEESAPAA